MSLFSVFCTFFSVGFVVVVFSANSSFKNIIKNKIIQHDGLVEISNYNNKSLSKLDYNFISEQIGHSYQISNISINNVVVRKSGISEACILKGLNLESNIYDFDSSLYLGEINKNGLIVGYKLFEKLGIVINDKINVLFLDDSRIFIHELPVSGVFKTNIPDFDKHNIYYDHSLLANESFINENSSIIINSHNNSLDTSKVNSLNENYYLFFWYDKYDFFLDWLNSYDAPVNILLSFIILICFVNIFSTFYIDTTYRLKEICLFSSNKDGALLSPK